MLRIYWSDKVQIEFDPDSNIATYLPFVTTGTKDLGKQDFGSTAVFIGIVELRFWIVTLV